MALDAAPRTNNPNGRPSNVILMDRLRHARTYTEDLEMEVRAAGLEMVAMSERITNVLTAGDSHSAMHFAARLGALGRSYLAGDTDHAA